MVRIARVVAVGVPHHVTQRGNNRQDVFFTDDDRRYYLGQLRVHAQRRRLRILAYCLMTNHVHLVVVPEREDSLAKALGRAHYYYTNYVNRLHGRSGHLWQNRFYSCPLGQKHLLAAARYVERNPVRAGMTSDAAAYAWSSAAAHVAGKDGSGVLSGKGWPKEWQGKLWREALGRPEDEEEVGRLRSGTRRGRPLGTDRFVSKLETFLRRRLRAMPVGRPRKTALKAGRKQ